MLSKTQLKEKAMTLADVFTKSPPLVGLQPSRKCDLKSCIIIVACHTMFFSYGIIVTLFCEVWKYIHIIKLFFSVNK